MKKEFFNGIGDTIPLILAAIPFGIVYGAMAHSEGLSLWAGQGMSLFVFAGASQFIATLLWENTPALILVLTIGVVNLRHMLYSASLMKYTTELSTSKKVFMGFLITDETYAAVTGRASKPMTKAAFFSYFCGSAIAMYSSWQVSTFVGILTGTAMPQITEWGLDIAMVVAFIGIVVPLLRQWAQWLCAVVAIGCSILTYDWPYQTGLLFSSIVAITVGMVVTMLGQQQDE